MGGSVVACGGLVGWCGLDMAIRGGCAGLICGGWGSGEKGNRSCSSWGCGVGVNEGERVGDHGAGRAEKRSRRVALTASGIDGFRTGYVTSDRLFLRTKTKRNGNKSKW